MRVCLFRHPRAVTGYIRVWTHIDVHAQRLQQQDLWFLGQHLRQVVDQRGERLGLSVQLLAVRSAEPFEQPDCVRLLRIRADDEASVSGSASNNSSA